MQMDHKLKQHKMCILDNLDSAHDFIAYCILFK